MSRITFRSPVPAGIALVLAAALGSCTPFGGWLYDDPSFVLKAVDLRHSESAGDSMRLVFTICNRNDFTVIGTSFAVATEIDGMPLDTVAMNELITLNLRDSVRLIVPVGLKETPDTSRKLKLRVSGFSLVKTPIGDRRVPFDQRGAVKVRWDGFGLIQPSGRACRPGLSTMPGGGSTPVVIPVIEPERPPPGVQGGNRP